MGIRRLKSTTPSQRFVRLSTFDEITTDKPRKQLLKPKKRSSGRDNQGKISVRRRGGGHKRRIRSVDYRRDKDGIPATVKSIEYDPNRSALLALLSYRDGEWRYILAPLGLKVGDTVMSGPGVELTIGNCLPLQNIPAGAQVHNIEMKPGRGGQMARSAGSFAQVVAKEGKLARLRLPSSEIRFVPLNCRATIGQVGNLDHENRSLGKAGRARWLGHRPKVRGSAMNPSDHPHGGGEGKAPIGRHPVTPWGKPALGMRTRRKRKPSSKYIVERRKKR